MASPQQMWKVAHFQDCANPFAQGNAVVTALAGLFQRFLEEGAAAEQATLGGPGQLLGSRAVVAPTALREALHALDEGAFSVGEMSDAAEVLTAIYESLRQVRLAVLRVSNVFFRVPPQQ